MGQRQGPAAQLAILHEVAGLDHARGDVDAPLHVPQLAHVEVATPKLAPAEEDVRRSLDHPLPPHHPPPLVAAVVFRGEIGGQHRGLRLFDLQEEGIVIVGAGQQDHPAAGAHAAHPHHLAGHVHDPVAAQQYASVLRQGGEIGLQQFAEHLIDGLPVLGVGLADDEGVEFADPVLIVHQIRHLAEHLQVVATPRLGEGGLDALMGIDGEGIEHRGLFDVIVPDPHKAHLAVFPQLGAVTGRYHPGRLPLAGGIGPQVLGRHQSAGGQALEIPLPGAEVGLIEVVDGQHQVALGARIEADVGDMHVATGLDHEAGVRGGDEIPRHDGGRPAQEGEGGLLHPGMAHRHQLLQASGGLGLEHGDGIPVIGCGRQPGVRFARKLFPQGLAGGEALRNGEPWRGEVRQYRPRRCLSGHSLSSCRYPHHEDGRGGRQGQAAGTNIGPEGRDSAARSQGRHQLIDDAPQQGAVWVALGEGHQPLDVDLQEGGQGGNVAPGGQLPPLAGLTQQLRQVAFQLAIDDLEAQVQLFVLLRQLHQGAGQQAGALQGIVHQLGEEGLQPGQRARLIEAATAQGALLLHIVIDRRQQQAPLVAKGGIETARVQPGRRHQILHGGLGIASGSKRLHGASQDKVPIKFGTAHGISAGKGPAYRGTGRQVYPSRQARPIHVECLLKKDLRTNQKTS
ncbi:hypothetical protein D3C79_598410 [compost metagenome]